MSVADSLSANRRLRFAPMLLLASRGIPDLRARLGGAGPGALLVPTAANPLDDPGIPDEVERELTDAGLVVERFDLDGATVESTRAAVARADVVAVSGGDPFHRLAAARRTAFGDAVRASHPLYIGYSAGAMVAGPMLEPLRITSPFTPPPGLDLTGLRLTDVLVLPHANRPGRADRNAEAITTYAADRLISLRDGEVYASFMSV
jgi:dipeptidase E